eukprot:63316_1
MISSTIVIWAAVCLPGKNSDHINTTSVVFSDGHITSECPETENSPRKSNARFVMNKYYNPNADGYSERLQRRKSDMAKRKGYALPQGGLMDASYADSLLDA